MASIATPFPVADARFDPNNAFSVNAAVVHRNKKPGLARRKGPVSLSGISADYGSQ
jgi:hypothetical protein